MNNFQGGALDQICVFERFLEEKKSEIVKHRSWNISQVTLVGVQGESNGGLNYNDSAHGYA